MKEATKTICFVVAAVAMLVAAIASSVANRPRPVTDFETIGQPFYPDFVKTDVARSLVVNSLDDVAVKRQKFEIKQEDGLWQIPSHEGYPAEAARRLAGTSASLMGITRDSLVGRSVADHAKFGVIDPRSKEIVDTEGVGQSITLKDANDDVLIDLIIGKKVTNEGDRQSPGQMRERNNQTYYYVRRQDESKVYRIPLQIALSTKFADWIEPDLLQIEPGTLLKIELNNYQIEQRGGGMFGGPPELLKKPGDQISLTRKEPAEDWTAEGLDEATEKLKVEAVDKIEDVLDDMAIVDVRRKPTLDGQVLLDANLNYCLTPDQAKLMSVRTQQDLDQLSNDEQLEFQSIQNGMAELQQDLQSRGFNFGSTGQKLELVSAGGEVQAATTAGLVYTLHVGKPNADQKKEIKVAGSSDESTSASDTGDDSDQDDGGPSEENESGSEEKTSDNRYVLIRVEFDEAYLVGEGPVLPEKPVAPVKPEGYVPEGKEEPEGDDDAAPKPKAAERDEAFAAYDVALAEYEQRKVDYEVSLSEYETDKEERDKLVNEGKQKAKILNNRFEEWYYVVSGEKLDILQADRETLIEEKEAPAEPEGGLESIPDTSFPEIEVDAAAGDADMSVEKPSMEKPPTQKPPTEEPPVEAPEADSPPVETSEASPPEQPQADPVETEMPETKVEPAADSAVEVQDVMPDSEAPTAPEEVNGQ